MHQGQLFLVKIDYAIVDCKPMAIDHSVSLSMPWAECEAKLCVRHQASDGEKHLVVFLVQTESTGKVAAMAVARIKRK